MAEIIDIVPSYVPNLILKRFADSPTPLENPTEHRSPMAVLFADISGFTRIAESLASQGGEGAERLTDYLNTYFGQMISIIASHGGDIVKFAGDALFAIWYNDKHDQHEAVLRATQCAMIIREDMNDYALGEHHLYVRVSIGAGEVLTASVGGVRQRWEFLIAGHPLVQVGVASEIAKPGQVILSPEAWHLVETQVNGTILQNDNFLVEKISEKIPARALPQIHITEASADGLMGFVSGAIIHRMAVLGEGKWLAENRNVTIMFLQVLNLDFDSADVVQQLQDIMQIMQVTLYHYEGSVRQLIHDDKGTVFIAAFGLPPFKHQDDAVRGVQAAISMQVKLAEKGYQTRIGITSGKAFCAPVGNTLRREYAMVGSVVNLSARLMGATKKHKVNILCDEATYHAANARLLFKELPPIALKNIAEPVKTYTPYGENQVVSSIRPIVGRQRERDKLTKFLRKTQEGENNIVLIEGRAGIGKSRLVADLQEQATALQILHITGMATSVNKTTPNYVWNDIFTKLFDFNYNPQTTMRRKNITLKVMQDKELLQSLPLLKGVLNLDLPDAPDMLPDVNEASLRLRRTRDVMLKMLQVAVEKEPLLIVLENGQWMDSNSWDFAYAVAQEVKPLLLVIVSRPLDSGASSSQDQLINELVTERIVLQPLNHDETAAMIRHCLGVAELAPEIEDMIYTQAQGNPFFSEEIAYSLRDSGAIYQEGGAYRLKKNSITQFNIVVPETLQGIITGRIDRLPADTQLTLKVASVIGIEFTYRVIYDIYPIESYKSQLKKHLEALQDLDLIEPTRVKGEDGFVFKQTLTHEVTYNLLPFTQRRELHEAVAKWYERNFVYDLSPYYGFLAHHWQAANHREYAVKYLEKAGEQSIKTGAYQEAIETLKHALTFGVKHLTAGNNFRLAHWERLIAEAYWGLGGFVDAKEHLISSLVWLNLVLPQDLRKASYKQMAQQARHRLFPRRYLGKGENSAFLSEAAHTYRLLSEVAYYSNDHALASFAGLAALNTAESANERHPELPRVYANAFINISQKERHGLAKMYKRLALSTAEKMNKEYISAPVLARIGSYDIVKGQWTSAWGFIEQAAKAYDKIGDKRGWNDTQYMLGFLSYFKGDFWQGSEIFDRLAITAQVINNVDHRIVGLSGNAMNMLALDKMRLATSQIQQAKALWEQEYVQPTSRFFSQSIFALVTLRGGNLPKSREAADVALTTLETSFHPIAQSVLFGVLALAEIYLDLWALPDHREGTMPALEKLQTRFISFQKHYPAAKPFIAIFEGHYARLHNDTAKANKLWQTAIASAEKLSIPYAEGLAHYNLATHATDATLRQNHLNAAKNIFEELHATYYLTRLKQIEQAKTPDVALS